MYLVLVVLAVLVLAFLLFFTAWQPFGRNRSQQDLAHQVRSLLLLMEDGGKLNVSIPEYEMAFEFQRTEGDVNGAVVVMRIPWRTWAEEDIEEIIGRMIRAGYESSCVTTERSEKILEVRIPVADIWHKYSGSGGARAARLILETFGVRKDAKVNFHLSGRRSSRMIRQHEMITGE